MERKQQRWLALAGGMVVVMAVVGGLFLSGTWGSGTVNFMVHDAPCSQCSHVWITFTSVSVHGSGNSGSGWIVVNVSGATFDLQALNGSSAAKLLGVGTLAAGQYQQIRITISKVVVDLTSGVTLNAAIQGPNGDFNGGFTVKGGATTTLSIDVDLAASLHLTPGPGGSMNATFTPDIATVGVSGP